MGGGECVWGIWLCDPGFVDNWCLWSTRKEGGDTVWIPSFLLFLLSHFLVYATTPAATGLTGLISPISSVVGISVVVKFTSVGWHTHTYIYIDRQGKAGNGWFTITWFHYYVTVYILTRNFQDSSEEQLGVVNTAIVNIDLSSKSGSGIFTLTLDNKFHLVGFWIILVSYVFGYSENVVSFLRKVHLAQRGWFVWNVN